MHIIISSLALLLLFFSADAIAVQKLPTEQGSPWISEIEYVEDAHQVLDAPTALKLLRHYNNPLVADQVFNLGLSNSHYWLRVGLHNRTAEQQQLRLLASVAYRLSLKALLVRDDQQPVLILEDSIHHHFDQRNADFRYLSSTPFELAPGDSADVLIEYHTLGSSYLPLSVVTTDQFASIMHSDSVNGAFFYSFSLAAILVFMLFSLAMMDRVSALYGLLFMLGLLFIASMEGYAFKYLWPHWPAWNNVSPLTLQYALSGFGLLVSWQVVTDDGSGRWRIPYVRSAIAYLALLCGLLMLGSLWLPFLPMARIASLLLALMFLSQGYALSSWISLGQKRNAVAIVAGLLLAVFVTVMVLLSFEPSLLPAYFYIYSTRLVYLLALLATMATIIAHVSGLRMDHEKTLQNELLLMQREAETNRALFEAEQNYSRARELAGYRQQQLATASHDMRQPLFSLRSTIDAIAQDEPAAIRNQLRNAFDYLENLCSDYLRDSRPADSDVSAQHDATQATEPYDVSLIVATAARMFSDEAEHKALIFRQRSCRAIIDRPPLVVMRIVTNLLSNAIKHTAEGRILLAARRRRGQLCIQIYDTGAGMDRAQLQRFSQAYAKGADSSGEGLGLAICRQLAEQQGMRLEIDSVPGRGTCCSLYMPRVN